MDRKPGLLFVCQHNSRRSQMAEGFAKHWAGDRLRVYSAGLNPSSIDPLTIAAMAEVGIDLRSHTCDRLADFDPADFRAVISLCGCGVHLPDPWTHVEMFEDWQLADPAHQPLVVYRAIRDQIQSRVQQILPRVLA
ncbi:arsenate reductase/protein-tyrosine-phosphatase family protein [Lyngbya confervoides]|uniref:ArsC family transcriptional regulator n=1 Tax=Lyngbya confervoides BDU141951 TaxID=1574623 RepID=A0ABD4T151_9CYAN|nr:ArsC family transcriptional regulator [Lyngbya confervoides]MCM1982374.1 ArsC family transcriptional regulator [Lyngbya confervoides BDU141951]